MKYGLNIRPDAALDFVSVGALVHRLDPGIIPFRKATECQIHVSGGEFNCAANLADCFGLKTGIVTAMVDYPIGDLIAERVRAMGVRPFYKRFKHNGVNGPNMAAVYSDRGQGVRAPVVFYNRCNEAGALLKAGDFDWKEIFAGGVRWFHSGGIFAALSETTSDVIIEGMKAAKAAGAVVSFDLNYRAKLWNIWGGHARALEVIAKIVENVDVLVGNEEDLQMGLGIPGPEVAAKSKLDPSTFFGMIDKVVAKYPKVKIVATTLREVHSTNHHSWSAVAWIDGKTYIAPTAELTVLDRVGGGDGYASGSVYHGDEDHVRFMNEVYAANSQSNPLHSDLWPSTTKYEAEIISMTARMLGAGGQLKACGVVTSGGTESIMLAMKAYRDWAREERKISRPEMIVPSTAHPAFDKAAHFFDIRIRHVPVGPDFRADLEATRRAISHSTAVIVGSAPSFPHGVVDPIEGLSELARERGIGFHTDACLGGFILPWAEELGYPVPAFDLRLPGVTSISVDTHKYGYAPKGTSVILYRDRKLRHHQYFMTTEWPGGIYFTPTFAGSRPGALSAACWAALVSTGQEGYREATRQILEAAGTVKQGIEDIPGLRVLGEPLWDISFTSDEVDIYEVLQSMTDRGWSLNGLQKPPAIHICLTLRHARPGVAERLLEDLNASVRHAGSRPPGGGGKTAMYGMAATFPDRRLVKEALNIYLDTLYEA